MNVPTNNNFHVIFPIITIKRFVVVMIGLTLFTLVMTVLYDYTESYPEVLEMFVQSGETTIPTWIHTILLFLGSMLAWLNYRAEIRYGEQSKIILYGWLFFSFLLISISADEASMVHERIGNLYHQLTSMRKLKLPPGWFLTVYAPLILGSVLFLSVFFVKFFKKDKRGFYIASMGLCVWMNSIAWEKIDGIYRQSANFQQEIRYIIRYITEYSELGGTLIFLFFMMHHLQYLVSYGATTETCDCKPSAGKSPLFKVGDRDDR